MRDERAWEQEGDACIALLRDLIRIPTVNRGTGESGDGNERPAAERVAEHLRASHLEPRLFEPEANRTSMVVRLLGTGEKPPILLSGHLDVVEADASRWQKDPFGGEIYDGFMWGRGAIDMKHMVAMSACVMSMLKRDQANGAKPLSRDVIFAAVADEEAGCAKGSQFLVDSHADEVRAEFVLSEIGAFSLHLFGRTFYPIQVAEKGACQVRATFEGTPGHGSMPNPESAVIKLSKALARLGSTRLPHHPVDVVTRFLHGIARELPQPQRSVMKRLTTPMIASLILDYLVRDKDQQSAFGAMLSNTASPTIVRAGNKINVIPGHATVEIDGRTLPGQNDESFLRELEEVLGREAKLEVIRSAPAVETSHDTPLFAHLARTIVAHDPTGIVLPYMIPGFTDAKAYAKLGTRAYGFSPVKFDSASGLSFSRMYHGDDERVPVAGVKWGLKVLYDAVRGFCE
jgi:acetylornithine deacetylase/succinyl-diaminopimelate desuccinylase-like protein